MNVLDKIGAVLNLPGVKLGFLPAEPDTVTALFEYSSSPSEQSFEGTDFVYGVQARCRAAAAVEAYASAEAVCAALNRYHDVEISVLQSTPILDIGMDGHNPPRQEYTVNFEVRRY